MYTFEYLFYPKTFEIDFIDKFDSYMMWFISCLAKNGQILTSFSNTVKYKNYYAVRVVAFDMESIKEKYWNEYCIKFYKEVCNLSIKPPEFRFIGENYNVCDCCNCKEPSYYILYSDFSKDETPVICGDCHRCIPLYKLPKTYLKLEYFDLLNWQSVYCGCFRQFLEGVGEHHGYKMIHNPKSELSKFGLKLCAKLEKKTKKPFYYYIYTYYKKNKKKCPKCGRKWVNNKKNKYNCDYICHHCRLIADD